MPFSILTSDRTSLGSSSNLRKAVKANEHITTERKLYKEIIESALQATNCSNWKAVIGPFLDVWQARKHCAPARILFTKDVQWETARHLAGQTRQCYDLLNSGEKLSSFHLLDGANTWQSERRCRKSYQTMFSGLRLPFVVRREILEWSAGCSTNHCNVRENAQTIVRYRWEQIFLLITKSNAAQYSTSRTRLHKIDLESLRKRAKLYQMHCNVLPHTWKLIYRRCRKWKGWTEKCVTRFVRWDICH